MDSISLSTLAGWIAVHAVALVTAWCTRVAVRPAIELAVQAGFLAAMAGVAGVAWVCHHNNVGLWMPSAVVLVAMVLVAVTDVRARPEAASLWEGPAGR